MLRSLGDFISEITGGARDPARFEETDYRLAAAALLVHVATTDANFDEQERARLRDVLAERVVLGVEEPDALIESAVAATDLNRAAQPRRPTRSGTGRRR